jgi:hypothetical protein
MADLQGLRAKSAQACISEAARAAHHKQFLCSQFVILPWVHAEIGLEAHPPLVHPASRIALDQ